MADVTERLPFAISERLASTVEDVLARNGREIHYTIASVPFRLHVTGDSPMTLETAQVQKNQQDTEPDPGEQTFAGWWLRSQASWHEGAGAKFMEPRLQSTSYRAPDSSAFYDSQNIDVWMQGEMTLLRRAVSVSSSLNRSVSVIPDATGLSVLAGRSGAVAKYDNLDAGASLTTLYSGGTVNFTHVVATAATWFAAGDDGKIYSGPTSGVTTTPNVWSLTGADTTKATRIAWAKHRLWAVNGNKIYYVNFASPGTVAAPAATAALYTHPSTSWVYTDVTDITGGVLFAGYGDGSSQLQVVTLATDGSAPTMSGATTTAILPSDEKALRVNSLTGSLVCILTSRGARVASVQGSGDLQYGPLFLERPSPTSVAMKPGLTSSGRFWWATWGDNATLYRIDSSQEVDSGVFAYATDMNSGVSAFNDVTALGDRPVVVTAGGAVVYRHATELEAEGWLKTGRVRFRTEEQKIFKFISVTAAPLVGAISLDFVDEADAETRLITHSIPGTGELPVAEVPDTIGTLKFMALKITLDRSATDATAGPELRGFQIKALPAAKPQRIYTLPLECYDTEKWSTGQRDPYGYDGWARDRYLALRMAEDTGGVVVLRDYRLETPTAELVKIEGLKFIQLVQPDDRLSGGFGGILVATLRTLT